MKQTCPLNFSWQRSLAGQLTSQVLNLTDPLPLKGGKRTLAAAGRLVREMRGLTSMAWDDKYAR